MTSKAKEALEYFKGQQRAWTGDDKQKFYDEAVKALTILAAIESDVLKKNPPSNPESFSEYMADMETQAYDQGVNYVLEKLKRMGENS